MARKTAGEPEARQSLRSAVCSRFEERAAWVVCRVGRTIDEGARPAELPANHAWQIGAAIEAGNKEA